ncbi:MAG: O-antigen ligase family protein [Propionibacteriaceae bacterium]
MNSRAGRRRVAPPVAASRRPRAKPKPKPARTGRDRQDSLAALACVALLGGVLPIAATPLATDPVMPIRLLVIGIALAVGFWVPSRVGLSRPVLVALGVVLAVFVVAAFAGATPLMSLLGRYPRYEGLPMMLAYSAALVVGARILQRPRYRRIFVQLLALATSVNAVVAVVQLVTDPESRVTGLLGNSTTLGTYGLLAVVVIGWTLATNQRPILWAGTVAASACIVLSASRGVLVGTVGALAAALVVRRLATVRPRWQHLAIGVAVITVATLLVPTTAARVTGASPFSSSTVSGRLLLWQDALGLWLAHPVLGTGPSRFVDAINPFHTADWAAAVGPYAPPDSPHNVLLQVLCATGLLGVLALAGFAYLAGRDAVRVRSPLLGPAVVVAVGLAVTYLTSFTDPVTTTLAAFVVGGALATRPYDPLPTVQRLWPAGVTLAATGFLGGTLLVAEASYSATLSATDPGPAAQRAITARPWDPDVVRRVAYTVAKRAETTTLDTGYLTAPLKAACEGLPDSIECVLTLSSVRDSTGDFAGALADANAAIAIDETNVDAHLAAGIALAKLTRYPEAEAAFALAASLRPTAPEPWSDLATLYDLMGRTVDASAARAKAAELTKR